MRTQRGYSMIEVMVAITLSVIVTQAAISVFGANKSTSKTTAAIAAVSDNGRFALSFIEQSVRSGGYMACDAINDLHALPPPGPATYRQLNVMPAGATPVQNAYQFAFGGYEAGGSGQGAAVALAAPPLAADTTAGDWLAAGLDPLLTANTAAVPGVIKGSDVLVVRETLPQTTTLYTTAPYAPGTTLLSVNDTSSLATLALPHAAVLSNCSVSVAFQLSAVGAGTPGTLTMGAGTTIAFDPYAAVTPVDTAIFYIGKGRDNDGALYVWHDDTGASTELVPDVENMQVLYGIAPTTPNLVTQYVTADAVPLNGSGLPDFNRVISIKVAMLVASPPGAPAVRAPAVAPTYALLGTTVTAPLDTRMRKVFDITVAARNAAL